MPTVACYTQFTHTPMELNMSYTIEESKSFAVSAEVTYDALLKAIAGLEGKIEEQDSTTRQVNVLFHKTILGKVLGDRTRLEARVDSADAGSTLNVIIDPLDAIGRKLQFGARKGVSRTVLTWLYAHVDHHLKSA